MRLPNTSEHRVRRSIDRVNGAANPPKTVKSAAPVPVIPTLKRLLDTLKATVPLMPNGEPLPDSPQNMQMTSLTDNPKVGEGAISPDGRYVAYSLREPQQSIWVQQVSPESKVEVVPPSAGAILAVAFSPDGNYLYFVRDSKGYVVPALGGTPRLIIEDTFGGIGVSPDGRKLAFVEGGDAPKSQLIVVNQDGSGAHVIAEHPQGSGVKFNSAAAPSWSPDGTLIAMPAIRKTDYVVNVYPAEGGPPSVTPLPGVVVQALWLPDQSGLLLTIASSFTAPSQVWLQPFPKGTLQRLTNGLDGYLHLSLSRDGRSLGAVRVQTSFTMFVGPASRPEQGTAISARKVGWHRPSLDAGRNPSIAESGLGIFFAHARREAPGCVV